MFYPPTHILSTPQLFGRIKGLCGVHLAWAVHNMAEEVGLTEKRNALAGSLSGGMKRKLCLAQALIGDPKFLLLDEPTSGEYNGAMV